MKIVIISTLWERTPPEKYGGTERVVYHLTEGLVKKGHEVTLFATGDSTTSAKLVSVYPRALYRDNVPWGQAYWPLINIAKAIEYAQNHHADVIHHHSQFYGYPFGAISSIPMIHTHHGNIDPKIIGPNKTAMMQEFKKNNYVSISDNQRLPMPELNWVSTVYNGVEISQFTYNSKPKDYLAWLGRFTNKKGALEAIKIAKALKKELILAGKIEKLNEADLKYYHEKIEPLIDGKQIKYIGEIGIVKKNQLLKNACCLLNPISWDEPFGLVPIEANACGTPVVTFNRGSMAEIIKNKVNGFLIKPGDLQAMQKKVSELLNMNENQYSQLRLNCREHAEQNFSIEKMVDGYEKVYQKIIAKK